MQHIHPLKTYRESQAPKLSQAALAERLGVARLTILRWEAGQRKIELSRLPEITEKTGIAANELRPDVKKLFEELAQ